MRAKTVKTPEDFAELLSELAEEAAAHAGRWENGDLPSYLAAFGRYVQDVGDFRRKGLFGSNLWRDLACTFAAAKSHE